MVMRIHIQNPADDPLFLFNRQMWDAAAARAPDVGSGHQVTVGDTDADFAAGIAEAEALITEIGVVAAKFPCAAPRLKLLFITNAGLDRLLPFDWAPMRHAGATAKIPTRACARPRASALHSRPAAGRVTSGARPNA